MTSDLYVLHAPVDVTGAAPFASWLLNASRSKEKVSMLAHEQQWAFCCGNEVWLVERNSTPFFVMLDSFRRQALDTSGMSFVGADLFNDLIKLSRFLAEPLDSTPRQVYLRLAPLFEGDLWSAARLGDWQETTDYNDLAQAAYSAARLEEQHSLGAPAYYRKLSIPYAKLQAEAALDERTQAEWRVEYDDLWLRVLCHETGDPLLNSAYAEGRSAFEVVAHALDMDVETARAVLVWQVYGREMDTLQRHFPSLIESLPANLPGVGLRLDKRLAALCAGISSMHQAYWQDRRIETLYGRRLRPGKPMGEASAFRVFGTVEDFIAAVAVTLWQNRTSPDIIINTLPDSLCSDFSRIGGTFPKSSKDQWMYMLRELAPMNNPFRAGNLRPQIVEV
mgnify:CR=1 FL=1